MKVAIIGGGPSGLTLAAILKATKIPFTVFELDVSPSARGQGGMLDIHKNSGQLALAKAGLLDEFRKCMRVDATDLYLRDKAGKLHWYHTEKEDPDPERPEIDRGDLRRLLLSALDECDVKWGKKLVEAEKDNDAEKGKFTLHFSDGTREAGFDVLVGADGTWSKVRPLRSIISPSYVGITAVTTSIANIDARFPELAKFVGNGTCMLLEGSATVVAQKSGDGSVKTYAFISVPEDWKETSGIDWSNHGDALSQFVARYHSEWAPEVRSLIAEGDEGDLAIRPLYRFPPGHKFEKECPGAVLMGDAAQVITPFTGEGVNLAMHDAYNLGVALEQAVCEGSSVEALLGEYERMVQERASFWSKKCVENQSMSMGGRPVPDIVAHLRSFLGW